MRCTSRIVAALTLLAVASLLFPAAGLAQGKKKGEEILKVDGKLTSEDAKDKVRTSCHHKVHTIKLEQDATYVVDLVSDDFDAYLRLENSEEKEVAKDDDKGGDFNARIVFRPPQADTYRIIVTTFGRGETGRYKLIVTRQPDDKGKDKQKQ